MIKGYPDLPIIQVKGLILGLGEQMEPEVHHQTWVGLTLPAEPPVDGVLGVMQELGGIIWVAPERPTSGGVWRISHPYSRWIAMYQAWWRSQLHWIDMGAGKGALRAELPKLRELPVVPVLAVLMMAIMLGTLIWMAFQ